MQILYQWELTGGPIHGVVDSFWTHVPVEDSGDAPASPELSARLRAFAAELAVGVAGSVDELDTILAAAAENWRVERMPTVDRIILRLAVYEFLHELTTPARVIINEALELARTFSTDEAVRFINGMLDGIRRTRERA